MIYVTGDTHADYRRFSSENFPEQKEMTKDDYLIVCGDFGIWDTSADSVYWLDWLDKKPFTTLFVDGNHENFDLLSAMPIEKWHGGNVHFIRPSVIHLMRGQLFEIEGKRFFTMGGATSHDISDGILEAGAPDLKQKRALLDRQGKYLYRINHLSWWAEELPSDEEYAQAEATLENCGWQVDYIITHCAPSRISDILSGGLYQADVLTDFLEKIAAKCAFTFWFMGHYHDNRSLSNQYIVLYEQIVQLH